MKARSNSALSSAASSRVVSVRPSQNQLERLALVAALMQCTIPDLLISVTLAELDSAQTWHEFEEFTHHQLDEFADGKASRVEESQRAELMAPDRLLRLCGYKVKEVVA